MEQPDNEEPDDAAEALAEAAGGMPGLPEDPAEGELEPAKLEFELGGPVDEDVGPDEPVGWVPDDGPLYVGEDYEGPVVYLDLDTWEVLGFKEEETKAFGVDRKVAFKDSPAWRRPVGNFKRYVVC